MAYTLSPNDQVGRMCRIQKRMMSSLMELKTFLAVTECDEDSNLRIVFRLLLPVIHRDITYKVDWAFKKVN